MSQKSLEERIKNLEELNEVYRKKIQHLDDIHELQNLMGRYVYKHEVMKDPEFADTLYAQKAPDVSWEVAHMGYFEGKEGVKRILKAHGPDSGTPAPGTLYLHTLTTPVIEIAGDGKTAKGVWHSPGAETMPDPETKELRGFWAWTKYGVDFIKEEGKWKIWHYHVYRIFLTPADMNYTDEYELKVMAKQNGDGGPMRIKPDGPTTYDNPYSKSYIPELVPAPPVPYETFSETFSYGKQKK